MHTPDGSAAGVRDGLALFQDGRVPEAAECLARAVAEHPDSADAQHLYGVTLSALGRFEQSAAGIERAIALQPKTAAFHNDLGNAYAQLGRLDLAEQEYGRALQIDPAMLHSATNQGILLGKRGQHRDAERRFQDVLARDPAFLEAHQNLAQLYLDTSRPADAERQCILGLASAPGSRGIRQVLGRVYGALGRTDDARELYRNWLEQDPTDAYARHHLAALTAEPAPAVASAAYVRGTFDAFAPEFEQKLAELEYAAPRLVGDALAAAVGAPHSSMRIADAGCGTGLCAPFLRPYASTLIGVDLSGAMLERAAARQVYDELHEGDLVAFLESHPSPFDAIVSADTLCYFGVLDDFARVARSRLASDGWLIFTVEVLTDSASDAPWTLQPHGRYAHRRAYVEAALTENGFLPHAIDHVTLRKESGKPVYGWLVTARRSS